MNPQRSYYIKPSRKDNNMDSNMMEHSSAQPTTSKNEDFDEAFKNLLLPIELITKKNHCEPLQYNLFMELDSYLNHLKNTSSSDSKVFVDAALIIQNVILIYIKRVDQYVDSMMHFIVKFQSYRTNLNGNAGNEAEVEDRNTKKKKEKKIKHFFSFEHIKLGPSKPLKIYDCKLIDISKMPCTPKISLNANIKVDNMFGKILPHIMIKNENIGNKYDFMVNFPLNCDLAVDEEFDLFTNEVKDTSFNNCLNRQTNDIPPPMNMDVDDNEVSPAVPDPVVFDQTLHDGLATRAAALFPENLINTSQIPQMTDDDVLWGCAVNNDGYPDVPIVNKKVSKKEDNAVCFPSFSVTELCVKMNHLKFSSGIDYEFRHIYNNVRSAQLSEMSKKRLEHIKEGKKQLLCAEEPEFVEFDNGGTDFNFHDQEQLNEDKDADAFQKYQANKVDMQKYDENKLEIVNEQIEMKKRIQNWHDNLKPILEAEEKRNEFDVHEYGTEVLDCFDKIGKKHKFKELVGELEQEEVARYYVSVLMMTNTGNVKIINPQNPDEDMEIELLNKERHHEQLQVNIGNQVTKTQKK